MLIETSFSHSSANTDQQSNLFSANFIHFILMNSEAKLRNIANEQHTGMECDDNLFKTYYLRQKGLAVFLKYLGCA